MDFPGLIATSQNEIRSFLIVVKLLEPLVAMDGGGLGLVFSVGSEDSGSKEKKLGGNG